MKKIENSIINVVLYCRVSTDEQAQKGFSLDYQEESLIRFCEKMGYNIIKIYREDHSAKNFNRPQWSELHSYIRANRKIINKVLFAKWDRFSRNIEQALTVMRELETMGIEVNASEQYLDATNADNKMILSIYLTAGEVERDKISSRTRNGTYQAKREGYFTGRAPFGYDNFRDEFKKSTLKPNKDAHFVTRAFQEVAMNLEPIEDVRRKLNKEGMNIEKSMFSELLKNIVYAGKIAVPEYKKESTMVVDGKHEGLTDIDTYNKVQEIFKGKRWYGLKPSHRNLQFPLRDFLTCEICNCQITGSTSKGRNGKYDYYHCRSKCKTRVRVETAHIKISELLKGLQINQNVKELFNDVLKDSESKIKGDKKNKAQAMLERQKYLKSMIEAAEDRMLAKDISSENYKSIVNRYNKELMNLNSEIEVLNNNVDSIKDYINDGLELLVNLNQLFCETDYDGKRILAGSLFTKKLLFGNNNCRTTEVNEVLSLLTRNSKGFEGGKKRKAVKNDDFSAWVPYWLKLSNFIEDFSRIRKLKAFMEIKQLA